MLVPRYTMPPITEQLPDLGGYSSMGIVRPDLSQSCRGLKQALPSIRLHPKLAPASVRCLRR